MAQVADHFTGADTALAVESGFAAIGVEGPQPAEFGSKGWYAQQLGSAAGMVVPFLLLRGGLGRIAEEGTQSAALETVSLTRAAVGEARLSGATGMIYGSVLTPGSAANVHNSDFYKERLSSGLTDMATFGALGFSWRYLSAGFEAAAGAIERSSLPALARESLVSTLRFPLIAGAASGIPSGSINAEVNALKDGRLLATGDEFKESIAGMTFVGAAMSTAPWLLGKAQEVAGGKNEVGARPGGQKENTDTLKGQPLDEAALKDAVERALKRISLNNGMGPQEAQGPQSLLLGTLARMTGKPQGQSARGLDFDAVLAAAGEKLSPVNSPVPGLEVVLGASGIEAPAHAGFLKALEESDAPVGRITGVSGGSLVATLYANKYSPEQIKSILLSDQFRYPRLSVMADCLHIMDPWNLYPYSIDFRPWLQDFVDTYHLKPQPNLRLVAADSKTHEPVVFEGTDYDLATALTASTAATTGMNMKPVAYQGRELIDGFYYHPTPAALSQTPAIVSKIGFVSKLPSEPLAPWDYLMHLRELSYYDEFNKRYPDPPGHIIAETGLPDVATTAFGVSTDTLNRLVQHGYDATAKRLAEPDAVKAIADSKNEEH
jgi:hypothetical protein